MSTPLPARNLPAILSLEAVGLGPERFPVEIGIANSDGNRSCWVVTPEPRWLERLQRGRSAVHPDLEALASSGQPPASVAELLNNQLKGAKTYSEAWGRDIGSLRTLFEAAGMLMEFEVVSISDLLSPAQRAAWSQDRARIASALLEVRPRASIDALVTQLTYAVQLGVDVEHAVRVVSDMNQVWQKRLVSLVPLRFETRSA